MTRDLENREWLNEYPSLKQVNKNNPFLVPDGYFNELGGRVTSAITIDALKNKMPLSGFVVPDNYFEELSDNIQSRVNIDTSLSRESGFEVPDNYFDELSANIQSKINLNNTAGNDTGFTVPDKYFEQLSASIQSRVFVEEALNASNESFVVPENYFEELSSTIQSRIFVEEALITSEQAFTLPQDYFDNLNKKILNKTVNLEQVKRKGVVIRMFRSTAFKYATAACLALMIGTGIFIRQFNDPAAVHKRSFLHKQLSNVPVSEIESYLDLNVEPTDTQHIVASDDLSVDGAGLNQALQNYTNNDD
ncbi:MAG: hypothetical protein ACXVAY_08540 [Mucilaginibacter sp.]